MFGQFWKYKVAGLYVVRVILWISSAPFMLVFLVYGVYSVVTGFLWVALVDAAVISGILIFTANFFMAFAALFDASIWSSMGAMWEWLAGWFVSGNFSLWPHFVKSFPPYFGAGIVFMMIFSLTEYFKNKVKSIQATAKL